MELVFRLGIALAVSLLSWERGQPWTAPANYIAAFGVLWSVGIFLARRRQIQSASFETVISIGDALLLTQAAQVLSGSSQYSWVGAAAVLVGTLRGAQASWLAPFGAAAPLAAHFVWAWNRPLDAGALIGAAAALAVPLIVASLQAPAESEPAREETMVAVIPEAAAETELLIDEHLALRDNFRRLRDEYRDLERRSKIDRLACVVFESRLGSEEGFLRRLATKLHEALNVEGVLIHMASGYGDTLLSKASSGALPDASKDLAIEGARGFGLSDLRNKAERLLNSVKPDNGLYYAAVPVTDQGRVVALLSLAHEKPDRLSDARERTEDLAPLLGPLIREESERQQMSRRLKEAELLYEIAAMSDGADSPTMFAARMVREMGPILGIDHLGVYLLEEGELLLAACEGPSVTLIEQMSFAYGQGLRGWLLTGSPELVLLDTAEDQRCPLDEARKRRIGSYVVIPIQTGDQPYGFLSAATHLIHGIDPGQVEGFRLIASELAHAFARYTERESGTYGIMTPKEFRDHVSSQTKGVLIYLEPVRKAQLIESIGRPALNRAVRQFAFRLRAKLPAGGCICRRNEGDLVAFIPDATEEVAAKWANEATTLAAMVGILGADADRKVPLGIRAKVAQVGSRLDVLHPETKIAA